MAQRWTGYTSGTQNLLSSIIENKKLALQAQAQADTASYRKQLLDFQQDEKVRTEEWKETVATWRHEDKIRADTLESKKADLATTRHGDIIDQAEQGRIFQGVQLFGGNPFERNAKGDLEIISAVIKNKKTGKNEANPLALERNLSVDVEGKRFIPVAEKQYETRVISAIDQALGISAGTRNLEKVEQAKSYPVDPFLTDPDEKAATENPLTWLRAGFDEEEALDNLLAKRPQFTTAVDMMKQLKPTDPKRIALYNSLLKLRDQIRGDKYKETTAWYAVEGDKYGKIRKALDDEISSHLKRLQQK